MEVDWEMVIPATALLMAVWCLIQRLKTTRLRWTEQAWWALVAVIVLGMALFIRAYPELVFDVVELPIGILALLAMPVFWSEFWKYLIIDVEDNRMREESGQQPTVPKWRQMLYLAVRLFGMVATVATLALFIWPIV